MTETFVHGIGILALWDFGDKWLHFVPIDEQVLLVLAASQFCVRQQRPGVEQLLSCTVCQLVAQTASSQVCNQLMRLRCQIVVASHWHALFWGS